MFHWDPEVTVDQGIYFRELLSVILFLQIAMYSLK